MVTFHVEWYVKQRNNDWNIMSQQDFLQDIEYVLNLTGSIYADGDARYHRVLDAVFDFVEKNALQDNDTGLLDDLYFVKELTGKYDADATPGYYSALRTVLNRAAAIVEKNIEQEFQKVARN